MGASQSKRATTSGYDEPAALGSRPCRTATDRSRQRRNAAPHDREVFNQRGRLSIHSLSASYRPGPRYTILPLPNDVGGATVNKAS